MIQELKLLFARKLFDFNRNIAFSNFIRFREGYFLCIKISKDYICFDMLNSKIFICAIKGYYLIKKYCMLS